MTKGVWGDPNVDWEGINDAAYYIGEGLLRWGRIHVTNIKEKWSEVRCYCSFGWSDLHSITHPGHHFYRYGKVGMWLNIHTRPLIRLLNPIIIPYQKWLYRRYYLKAALKWPHLHENIFDGADFQELLLDIMKKVGYNKKCEVEDEI